MSPTSCHCSTPRCWERSGIGWWWGSLTCARDGLASHAVARAVLSGAGAGHDPVRDGTGWFDAALGHAHRSRTHQYGSPDLWEHHEDERTTPISSTFCVVLADRSLGPSPAHAAHGIPPESGADVAALKSTPPSTMSTASLRSVARRPRAASQPGRLPGVLPLSSEKVHLGAGFPLRCCQRLSLPNVATQHCR